MSKHRSAAYLERKKVKARAKARLKCAANKAAGLCQCGKKPDEGYKVCRPCLDKVMLRQVKKRSLGLCACGRESAPGWRACVGCRESRRRSAAARAAAKICATCGTRRPEKGMSNCAACRSAARSASEQRETEKRKADARDRKLRVLAAYGGRCWCCGEEEVAFLCIDHIGGGGSKHLERMAARVPRYWRGLYLYHWLEASGWPSGFRVLCFNCNMAEASGPCPHRRGTVEVTDTGQALLFAGAGSRRVSAPD